MDRPCSKTTSQHELQDYSDVRLGPDVAGQLMEAMHQEFRRKEESGEIKREWETLHRVFTIEQAAEKTGLPRHVIYKKIRDRQIDARPAPGGDLWLIPAPEVMQLMPETSGDAPDLISNN